MNAAKRLHLFAGYGIELEYMLVDRETLSVLPATDEVIRAASGTYESEIEMGELCWSNELVLHVIELKTNGPAPSLRSLSETFQTHVDRVNALLEPQGGLLMPTAAHPWMDPKRETVLWPHEYNPVYESFDRIFGCQGHGWSNLQCTHINLPFHDDEEFARLHAAIRLVLPLIPALAASSPILDGKPTGYLDSRLHVYRSNAKRIPSVTGLVVPEPVFSQSEYENVILEPLYRDIAPHDPEKILRYEWLNARGAIARFDRCAIEIRIVDIQECPRADMAVTHALTSVVRALTDERWQPLAEQKEWDTARLNRILLATTRDAEEAVITDDEYLRAFGYTAAAPCTARQLWRHLIGAVLPGGTQSDVEWRETINTILTEGTLARRILSALGDGGIERIREIYGTLCDCLRGGRLFHADGRLPRRDV